MLAVAAGQAVVMRAEVPHGTSHHFRMVKFALAAMVLDPNISAFMEVLQRPIAAAAPVQLNDPAVAHVDSVVGLHVEGPPTPLCDDMVTRLDDPAKLLHPHFVLPLNR